MPLTFLSIPFLLLFFVVSYCQRTWRVTRFSSYSINHHFDLFWLYFIQSSVLHSHKSNPKSEPKCFCTWSHSLSKVLTCASGTALPWPTVESISRLSTCPNKLFMCAAGSNTIHPGWSWTVAGGGWCGHRVVRPFIVHGWMAVRRQLGSTKLI